MMNLTGQTGKRGQTANRIAKVIANTTSFVLWVAILLVVSPVFSQTVLSGSTYSDGNRSTASYLNTQSAYTLNNNKTSFIHFKNVSSAIDPNYMDNARVLAILDRTLADHSINDLIDNITITGSASPDGFTERNELLAEERAIAIKRYITRNHPHVNSNRIITYSAGEDWNGLRQMITDDYATPERTEALRILNSTLSGDTKRKRLQQLASGRTYKYLSDNMFPSLRGGAAFMILYKKDAILTGTNSRNHADNYSVAARPDRTDNNTGTNERNRATNTNVVTNPGNVTNYNIAADQVNITNYTVISESGRSNKTETNFSEKPSAERRTVQTTQPSTNSSTERRSVTAPANRTDYNDAPVRYDNNSRATNYNNAPVRYDYNRYETTSATTPASIGRTTTSDYNMGLYDDVTEKKMLFAVKTNLLFDAVTALNIELEKPLGNSWSLSGEYIFPWWLNEQRQYAFQLITANLELRRWFGDREERPRMTGWFGGLFIGGRYFDFQRGSTGYQGESFTIGLSGGYAHEISRDGKWRMEYALGLGLIRTNYREYFHRFGLDDEWHLIRQKSGRNTYVGPVKAKISLVRTLNIKK